MKYSLKSVVFSPLMQYRWVKTASPRAAPSACPANEHEPFTFSTFAVFHNALYNVVYSEN